MKRNSMALLLAVMMLAVLFAGAASAGAAVAPKLYVNNKYVDVKLYSKSGFIMLPVRVIMNELGYNYTYSKNKVTITGSVDTVTFTRGSRYYYDNGVRQTLKVASALKYSMIYAPHDFFTDIMGLSVKKGSDGNYYVGSDAAVATQTPTATTYNIRVNNTLVNESYYVDPIGGIYVPLKAISTPLGYSYTQYTTTSAYVTRNSVSTMVEANNKNYTSNGQVKTLVNAVLMKGDKLYVPVEFMQTVMNGRAVGPVNNILEVLTDNTGVVAGSVDIRLNGTLLSVKGYIAANGMGYVPLESVAKSMGFTYTLIGTAAQIERSGENIRVDVYKDTIMRVTINGMNTYSMGYNTEYTNNAVYVPIKLFSGDYVSGTLAQLMGNVIYISTTGVINVTSGATKPVTVLGASYSGNATTRYVVGSTSGTYTALTSDILYAIGASISTSGNTVTITETRNGVTTIITTTVGTNSYSVTKNGSASSPSAPSATEWVGAYLYMPMEIVTSNSFLGHIIYPDNTNSGYIIYK